MVAKMKFYRCAILMLATSASSFPTLQRAVAANLSSSERIEIKVDPKAIDEETKFLWARFGTFCGIAEWHPTVRSCTEGKESGTTYRTLSLEDGGKIKEKLLSAGPSSYRYAIVESPLPVKH